MKRNVSVVCVCSAPNCCDIEQRSASQPGSVASGTHCIKYASSPIATPPIELHGVNAYLHTGKDLPFLGALVKLRKANISFVKSVHPHGTTPLPLQGFS